MNNKPLNYDDIGVRIPCQIIDETELALKIWRGRVKTWIPKSVIFDVKREETRAFVTLNRRIAEQKKLVYRKKSDMKSSTKSMYAMKCLDCEEVTHCRRAEVLRKKSNKMRCSNCGSYAMEYDHETTLSKEKHVKAKVKRMNKKND